MTKHLYRNHEIEVSTKDNGLGLEATARFTPWVGPVATFTTWANYSGTEAAEFQVLKDAHRIIDEETNIHTRKGFTFRYRLQEKIFKKFRQ